MSAGWVVRDCHLLCPPLMKGDRVKAVEDDGRVVAWVYDDDQARLIAAAPDLLKALQGIAHASFSSSTEVWIEAIDVVDAALRKATEEQSP